MAGGFFVFVFLIDNIGCLFGLEYFTILLMTYSDTDYGWLFKYLLYMWMVGKFEAHFIPEYFITQ